MNARHIAAPVMMHFVVPSHVRRWLPAIRARQDWGVREAAKNAGISSSTFNRVENGNGMDVATYEKLSAFIIQWWYR